MEWSHVQWSTRPSSLNPPLMVEIVKNNWGSVARPKGGGSWGGDVSLHSRGARERLLELVGCCVVRTKVVGWVPANPQSAVLKMN